MLQHVRAPGALRTTCLQDHMNVNKHTHSTEGHEWEGVGCLLRC